MTKKIWYVNPNRTDSIPVVPQSIFSSCYTELLADVTEQQLAILCILAASTNMRQDIDDSRHITISDKREIL